MMFMPYYFFFMISLFLGLFISLSSSSWLYVWMGLEINLISFIPLMMSSHTMMETESALKYFLIQAFGSGVLLFSVFVYLMLPYVLIDSSFSLYILVFSLMIKLGMAPFHFWLPHVMGGSSWVTCMMVSVVQKIAPMFVLFSIFSLYSSNLGILSGLGSLVGGLGGMNQTQLRFILAYSSIGHMGWMMMASMFSYTLFLGYFLVYSVINIGIMSILHNYKLKLLNVLSLKNLSLDSFMFLGLMFLSLAGLPPFLGFYPKMVVLSYGAFFDCFLILFLLVVGSLMNIFYYLSVFFNLYLSSYFTEFSLSGLVLHNNMYSVFIIFMGVLSTASIFFLFLFVF